MSAPQIMLKAIVFTHFFLSVWASMGNWMVTPIYIYVHAFVLACGLWAIISSESTDAVLMMLIALGFSILQDILLLALYEPRGYSFNESDQATKSQKNEYRFALGMCITNLLLKPFTGFLLFRIFQSRRSETVFTIPGVSNIPGFASTSDGYENIDRSPTAPYTTVESAGPHVSVTKE